MHQLQAIGCSSEAVRDKCISRGGAEKSNCVNLSKSSLAVWGGVQERVELLKVVGGAAAETALSQCSGPGVGNDCDDWGCTELTLSCSISHLQ